MTTVNQRTLRLGERRIPVVLPTRGDARLHTAAVIITIHIVGITALGFRVSAPQILSALVAGALIDVTFTLRKTGVLIWPASGLLTASGVALILRLVGMPSHDYWSWDGWYYFALIAGFSVLTKYLIRYRGTHVFNPSNFGLVVAFLVFGSGVIEPLDFWWGPPGLWLLLAYAVILVGGILITSRLLLLEMALVFWITLAAGLGVLAASGHCITAAWSLVPVCGSRFWWIVLTSPELLIFLLFMITDPKTVPRGRAGRVAFAICLAIVCTLLMAPQTVEFGAKVALLAGLVVMTPLRALFDRWLPAAEPRRLGVRQLFDRATADGIFEVFWRGTAAGGVAVLIAAGIVAAGAQAREPVQAVGAVDGGPGIVVEVDPASVPKVTLDPNLSSLNSDLDAAAARELAIALLENLAIEGEAIRRGDGSLLPAADAGSRLTVMLQRVDDAIATGTRVVSEYEFDSLHLQAIGDGGQSGAALGFDGVGTVVEVTYDGLGVEQSRSMQPVSSRFVMRQVGDDRWRIVEGEDRAG